MAYPAPGARIAEIVMFRPEAQDSPHGFFMASTQVSNLLLSSGGAHGISEQCGLIADQQQFRTSRKI